MTSETNSNAFYADYNNIASCLFSIQASQASGLFDAHANLLELLYLLEKDLLKKLYAHTIRVLVKVDGFDQSGSYIGGDFSDVNFAEKDFNVGELVTDPTKQDYFYGDFDGVDFFYQDFYVGFLDTQNTGYSSIFQSILNMLQEIGTHDDGVLSEADKEALNNAIQAVLDAFRTLQEELALLGLNPCAASDFKYLNNNSGVYLQVSGSDGVQGIAEGMHLRWSFTDELGNNHLPKGDFYNGNSGPFIGYNQANDYVHIKRIKYQDPVKCQIDFAVDRPVISSLSKTWTYTINQKIGDKKITNQIRIRFEDANAYNLTLKTVNPATAFYKFLNDYDGLISLQILDKRAFAVDCQLSRTGNGTALFKIEVASKISSNAVAEDTVLVRKTVSLSGIQPDAGKVRAENIESVRLMKTTTGIYTGFSFETYHDFLSTRTASDWMEVGNGFGISLNDSIVFDRLENSNYPINNLWPQYNGGTKVKVANYIDKWNVVHGNEPTVKSVVQQYLNLSDDDPRAEDVIKNVDDVDDPGFLISYLDILNLQALDYHMARMLGLGHIDKLATASVQEEYIYQLSYANKKSLASSERTTYSYMSLPTSKIDALLPEKPVMRALRYDMPSAQAEVNSAFDAYGYAKIDNVRVVNVGREKYLDEVEGYNFFADLSVVANSNIFIYPKPVSFGIEYKASGEATYVKPEITTEHMTSGTVYLAYDDSNPQGILETIPIMEDPSSLYVHFERKAGIHLYAIYGINWFSRASAVSDELATNETVFVPINNLQPPMDVAVQYIQKENILLFTTAQEQSWLKGRTETFPVGDVHLTRFTFNWIDIQDISRLNGTTPQELGTVVKPDTVKAFFREHMPQEIIGLITGVIPISNTPDELKLITGHYKQMDGTVVSPAMTLADYPHFVNSVLATTSGQYSVVQIESGNPWPIITIKKIKNSEVLQDPDQDAVYGTVGSFEMPKIGTRFTMVENLSNPSNWYGVAKDVALHSFASLSSPVVESEVDSENNVTKKWIGGIHGEASIIDLVTISTPEHPYLPGYYEITYNPGVTLAPHPQINLPFDPADPNKNSPDQNRQAHVEWYKGYVRIPVVDSNGELKQLEVIRIEQNSPLVLYVFDPTYLTDPIAVTAQTPVNFHPGYRAYFFTEPAGELKQDNILPLRDDNDKKTLVGLQMADLRTGGSGYSSSVSMPAVLLARNIVEPVQFEAPNAAGLKVRPDATGMAAFTFDVKILLGSNVSARKPFGFMFYRTTQLDILDALYSVQAKEDILTDLSELKDDTFYSQRYLDLANLVFDPLLPGQFKVYGTGDNAYGFPIPDKPDFVEGNLALKKEKYKAAIEHSLLPLTAQPPLFAYIKEGFYTQNQPPVIRDIDGNLLSSTDPDFNPFPMVRKFTKTSDLATAYIRFTDYTLSGASRNLYFFAGCEMDNQLEPGLLSPFAGPVTILQTMASAAPVITRVILNAPEFFEAESAVTFELAILSPEDRVAKIRVYRTAKLKNTLATQMMESHFDIELVGNSDLGYKVTDLFTDLDEVPFGETIYYRLAGIREIINEWGEFEDVYSLSSEVYELKLIDARNPEAPELLYNEATNILSWLPTTKQGTYYLFQQNNRGNWERIYKVDPPLSDTLMSYELPETLGAIDEDGDPIYYRYKVQVQNPSGLFNLIDKEETVQIINP